MAFRYRIIKKAIGNSPYTTRPDLGPALTQTDPDTEDTFTYQLVAGAGDTDNAAFTIVEDQLQINSSPDFETQSSYSIRVQTTDAEGESYSENLTININDVNEDTTAFDTPEEDTTVTSEEVIQLKITPSEPTKAVEPNTSISFDVNYSTEPAETSTTGIAFGMHWDSSQVAFDPITGLTERFPLGAQPISAVLDDPITNGGLDSDPNTDKYILQAWIDAEGKWPNNSNLTLTGPTSQHYQGLKRRRSTLVPTQITCL